MSDSDIKEHLLDIKSELVSLRTKVDDVHAIVHQHVGFINATKAVLAGIGAGFALILTYLGLKR
jgi:hypothetical protein